METEDLPDFLSAEPSTAPAEQPAQEPAAPATPPPEPQQEPAADAPLAATAVPEAPAAPAEPTLQHVPLPTFLDMRDKANAAERRARELETWRQQQEAAARRQPAPDFIEDPEGYQQHQAQQFQSALYTQTLNFSRQLAEVRHGPDVTRTAFEWGAARCDQDPFFNEKVRASPDPVGLVVEEWKREQLLTKLDPTDIEAFQTWKAQQAGQSPALTPQAAAQPPARPTAPRPSLAAAPSAGAHAAPDARDGEAQFGVMFGGS